MQQTRNVYFRTVCKLTMRDQRRWMVGDTTRGKARTRKGETICIFEKGGFLFKFSINGFGSRYCCVSPNN